MSDWQHPSGYPHGYPSNNPYYYPANPPSNPYQPPHQPPAPSAYPPGPYDPYQQHQPPHQPPPLSTYGGSLSTHETQHQQQTPPEKQQPARVMSAEATTALRNLGIRRNLLISKIEYVEDGELDELGQQLEQIRRQENFIKRYGILPPFSQQFRAIGTSQNSPIPGSATPTETPQATAETDVPRPMTPPRGSDGRITFPPIPGGPPTYIKSNQQPPSAPFGSSPRPSSQLFGNQHHQGPLPARTEPTQQPTSNQSDKTGSDDPSPQEVLSRHRFFNQSNQRLEPTTSAPNTLQDHFTNELGTFRTKSGFTKPMSKPQSNKCNITRNARNRPDEMNDDAEVACGYCVEYRILYVKACRTGDMIIMPRSSEDRAGIQWWDSLYWIPPGGPVRIADSRYAHLDQPAAPDEDDRPRETTPRRSDEKTGSGCCLWLQGIAGIRMSHCGILIFWLDPNAHSSV
ncbi:Hypothetical predicted protein [Lecanosticta acicola]|uniref:Uncharacterized protein n=1 Tax=Lecanosticta acicola TaxID=111012 RepID=A0AAI8Z809_9PEZI|nr:Hypothetical predicted protein [Lecanosticta acicola]